MAAPTRVLVVGHDAGEAAVVTALLAACAAGEYQVGHVAATAEAAARLAARQVDVILAGRGAALSPLVAAATDAGELPVIVLTETDDQEAGIAALQAGAQDYLVKGRINGEVLHRVIRYSRERLARQRDFDGLARQMAERDRIEEVMRESRHRMQAVTESLFEGVLVVDTAGRISFANPSARSLLGEEPGYRLAGRELDAVFTLVEDKAPVLFRDGPFYAVAGTDRHLRNDDARFQLRNGRNLAVAFACSPLMEGGRQTGLIISFRDIGRLKKVQQEALQASKLASVGQLAAGVAHEINTPTQYIGDNLRFLAGAFDSVTEVLTLAAAFAEGRSSATAAAAALSQAIARADMAFLLDEIPQAIAQSLDGVGQVARIVLAMKEFSHPGDREKSQVDLNRAIENTLAVSKNEWKHVAEIRRDLDDELPPVLCLPGEMNQVLLNLVVNAAHAIEATRASGKGHIDIATRRHGGAVTISVADNGTGMSEQVRERIFDPFFTTKGVGKGTGQGLAICRDVVVTKHGGRIAVDTEPGRGTTFTITLPIDGQPLPAEGP